MRSEPVLESIQTQSFRFSDTVGVSRHTNYLLAASPPFSSLQSPAFEWYLLKVNTARIATTCIYNSVWKSGPFLWSEAQRCVVLQPPAPARGPPRGPTRRHFVSRGSCAEGCRPPAGSVQVSSPPREGTCPQPMAEAGRRCLTQGCGWVALGGCSQALHCPHASRDPVPSLQTGRCQTPSVGSHTAGHQPTIASM